ncbi:UDP-N-acetylmuramoyl-L-alanyl-D-glutamate--2,6-diaminopimelate ligase [Caldicoprobacter guelmensis]|uniref:Mur ligase family protein n=1 Tax=Caldicoprobacter guelmensis TaxID=1170224 RepID=UPI00195E38AC|nr:Mur ligase family protein [Caldicoprobacter guelmensis]MBM7582277.1 UDP-N-acetylmuramoyl-L-alanyl-D-glutamate--2,6-diaminopimelate ligase [Caldicoprobacter guelmensis]
MLLKELLASTPVYELVGFRKIDITGIAIDPEEVKRDYLFIYAPEMIPLPYEEAVKRAVERGAVAICIGQDQEIMPLNVTFIKTYHINRFISAVARNFYHNPSQVIELVGITGSHGKSTIGWMIKSVLDASKQDGVIIGNTYCQMGGEPCRLFKNAIFPLTLNPLLYEAIEKGIRIGVVECSYTAIVKDLLRHIWFDSIIYTDLYTYFQNHRTDSHYLEIRKTLIDHLKSVNSPIILNVDDYYANQLKGRPLVGYGICHKAYVYAQWVHLTQQGSRFTVRSPEGSWDIVLNVPGIHNVYNALATIAWCLKKGMDMELVRRGLENFESGVPVEVGDYDYKNVDIYVKDIVDVEGLDNLYLKLKAEKKGKIVTLLPIGGYIEASKYKEIGQVVNSRSNHCILVTDYTSHSSMDRAFNIAQQMGNTVIGHEVDCYKAVQKAVEVAGENGCVFVLSPPNFNEEFGT